VSFPVATSIDKEAFQDCKSLTKVSFPAVTSIGAGAFRFTASPAWATGADFGLTDIDFPQVTTIGTNAFESQKRMKSVSFPRAISVGKDAFRDCHSISNASFPAVKEFNDAAFSSSNSSSLPVKTITLGAVGRLGGMIGRLWRLEEAYNAEGGGPGTYINNGEGKWTKQ
jgi:hypothetical protein